MVCIYICLYHRAKFPLSLVIFNRTVLGDMPELLTWRHSNGNVSTMWDTCCWSKEMPDWGESHKHRWICGYLLYTVLFWRCYYFVLFVFNISVVPFNNLLFSRGGKSTEISYSSKVGTYWLISTKRMMSNSRSTRCCLRQRGTPPRNKMQTAALLDIVSFLSKSSCLNIHDHLNVELC